MHRVPGHPTRDYHRRRGRPSNRTAPQETAVFMKESGLLSAGYNYLTLGGIGYANNSGPGGTITRNATGFIQ